MKILKKSIHVFVYDHDLHAMSLYVSVLVFKPILIKNNDTPIHNVCIHIQKSQCTRYIRNIKYSIKLE